MSDELMEELRGLRKGVGVTLSKLALCPNLLATFNTADPRQAHKMLNAAIADLPPGPASDALRNAYGLTLKPLPTLTQRRNALASSTYRHVKTIESYENSSIFELAVALAPEHSPIKLIALFNGKSLSDLALRRTVSGRHELSGVRFRVEQDGYSFVTPTGWDSPQYKLVLVWDKPPAPYLVEADGDVFFPQPDWPWGVHRIDISPTPQMVRLIFLEES